MPKYNICAERPPLLLPQVKIGEDGWPIHEESFTVTSGQQVIITTRTDVEASGAVLPITYDKFTEMAQKGDTIYIGRYLVCGADSASLYLEVLDVQGGWGGLRDLTGCWTSTYRQGGGGFAWARINIINAGQRIFPVGGFREWLGRSHTSGCRL